LQNIEGRPFHHLDCQIMSIGDELKVVDSNSFTILGKRVKMNSDSSVLINFHVTPPKVVSVVDLLYGRVSPDEFKGKEVS